MDNFIYYNATIPAIGIPEYVWTGLSCTLHLALIIFEVFLIFYSRPCVPNRAKDINDYIRAMLMYSFLSISVCKYITSQFILSVLLIFI